MTRFRKGGSTSGTRRAILRAMLAIVLLTLSGAAVLAQSGGGYTLSWWTVDSGGVTFSAGGGYVLGSTVGQPDAGVLAGGDYVLTGGFWGGAVAFGRIYLPLILRNAG